jgi:protein-disulfide isomerase
MASKLSPLVSEKDHREGPANAPIEWVEYGDYQCPHCGVAYPIIKHIQKELGKKLKFIFRNFPLSESHPYAFQAAVAAEAAGKQGRFWEMHDMLFENQSALEKTAILRYAKRLGLKEEAFLKDLGDESLAARVESDFESGIRSGVNGTPSFYINRIKYEGDYDEYSLLEALKSV